MMRFSLLLQRPKLSRRAFLAGQVELYMLYV